MIDTREDSKRSPDYKGIVPQKDNGCEDVYNRRTYGQLNYAMIDTDKPSSPEMEAWLNR